MARRVRLREVRAGKPANDNAKTRRVSPGTLVALGAVGAAGAAAYANRDRVKRTASKSQRHFVPFVEGARGYSPLTAEVARARRRRLRRTGTAPERVDDAAR